ncbi:MAG: MarC family protein [Candidatus Omnitrophica bacterium]|nr:MarC family protein [Candidatus Omnitrophota bacterium]
MLNDILLAFIPIFVAVDAIGVLPIFVNLTQGLSKRDKNHVIAQSLLTALVVAVSFVFLGNAIFKFLGITVADFMIAGGIVLFCIAIMDMLNPGSRRRASAKELGFVPLGTPLVVGPAVLTTSLMIISTHGLYATLISIVLNILLAGVVFMFSEVLIRVLGKSGTKALSKIISLLLAAIAVMMIRKGVTQIIHNLG